MREWCERKFDCLDCEDWAFENQSALSTCLSSLPWPSAVRCMNKRLDRVFNQLWIRSVTYMLHIIQGAMLSGTCMLCGVWNFLSFEKFEKCVFGKHSLCYVMQELCVYVPYNEMRSSSQMQTAVERLSFGNDVREKKVNSSWIRIRNQRLWNECAAKGTTRAVRGADFWIV